MTALADLHARVKLTIDHTFKSKFIDHKFCLSLLPIISLFVSLFRRFLSLFIWFVLNVSIERMALGGGFLVSQTLLLTLACLSVAVVQDFAWARISKLDKRLLPVFMHLASLLAGSALNLRSLFGLLVWYLIDLHLGSWLFNFFVDEFCLLLLHREAQHIDGNYA